jgi:hypothetical protein
LAHLIALAQRIFRHLDSLSSLIQTFPTSHSTLGHQEPPHSTQLAFRQPSAPSGLTPIAFRPARHPLRWVPVPLTTTSPTTHIKSFTCTLDWVANPPASPSRRSDPFLPCPIIRTHGPDRLGLLPSLIPLGLNRNSNLSHMPTIPLQEHSHFFLGCAPYLPNLYRPARVLIPIRLSMGTHLFGSESIVPGDDRLPGRLVRFRSVLIKVPNFPIASDLKTSDLFAY